MYVFSERLKESLLMAGSLYTLNTIKLQNVNHEMTAAHTMPFSAVETLKEG